MGVLVARQAAERRHGLVSVAHAELGMGCAAPGILIDERRLRARQMHTTVRTAHHGFRVGGCFTLRRGSLRGRAAFFGSLDRQEPRHENDNDKDGYPKKRFTH